MKRTDGFAVDPAWKALLEDLGIEPLAVLRRARLPEDLLSRPDTRLPTDRFFELWRALQEEGGELLPLRIATAVSAESFSPPLFAALCSPDLATAVSRIGRYKRLVAPMELKLDRQSGLSVTYTWLDAALPPPPSLVAFELAFLVRLARLGTRHEVRPVRVTAPEPLRPEMPYSDWFGVRSLVGDTVTVSFSAADSRRPFLTANPQMWSIFEPNLRRRLAQLDEEASFADRVHSALLDGLPSGRFGTDDIARRLGVSRRTLQRRLKGEGTTFQQVLQDTRESLARHYLGHTGLNASEIGFLLGFEESSSFFRAFHNWTGQTPETVRQALA